MAEQVQAALSIAELEAIVAVVGRAPGSGSPLPSPSGRPTADTLASLRAKGVLDARGRITATWAAPLSALGAPHSRLNATLISAALEVAASAYFTAGDGFVSWASDGAEVLVSYPHAPSGIFASITEWMGTSTVPEAVGYSDTMSIAAFTAFVACVDAFRHEDLLAVVERRPANLDRFTAQALRQQIRVGRGGDPRWLAGVLSFASDGATFIAEDLLIDGIAELQQFGWVARDGDIVAILREFAPTCRELSHTLPSMITTTAGAASLGAIAAVRGRSAFWAMARVDDGIAIGALDGGQLQDVVKKQLVSLRTPPTAEPVPEHASSTPTPAAAPLQAPVESPQICRKCGNPIKASRRFCTKCGTKIVA